MTKKSYLLLCLSLALVAADMPAHDNRVEYGDIGTGMTIANFMFYYPDFKEAESGYYWDIEKRSETDYSVQVLRPAGKDFFDRYIKKMPIRIFHSPSSDTCDVPLRAVFLAFPGPEGKVKKELLYAYDYLACAGTAEITGGRMMEKYMEKYGNYDLKDWDRDQNIYKNVKKKWEVRVKPYTSPQNEPGLVITVTDEGVFTAAYEVWRGWLRGLEESVKKKF